MLRMLLNILVNKPKAGRGKKAINMNDDGSKGKQGSEEVTA